MMERKLRVLVACEESQAVCKAFRSLGHEAYSCDLQDCSGGHPEWHFKEDIFEVIKREPKFDLMIAHPPCTFLAGSGVQWLSHPEDKHLPFNERRPHPKYPNRRADMNDGLEFAKKLYLQDIKYIAMENPVGLLSSMFKKPSQIIQPWQFGHEATKTTCLWLKNLPNLTHTKIVEKGEREVFASGKSHPKWYADAMRFAKTKEERQRLRSKTFQGIANAMASQWSEYILANENN
ncbi:MAG: hypothetical protein GY755_13650 [Chloroflexi bacterium]|nr:hypothetical protein [Chloroflexota bacterium]